MKLKFSEKENSENSSFKKNKYQKYAKKSSAPEP